jgi:hypothetical protein
MVPIFSKQKYQSYSNLYGFGIFYGNLIYFAIIWHVLWQIDIFYGHLVSVLFPVLVCCFMKNLATLPGRA